MHASKYPQVALLIDTATDWGRRMIRVRVSFDRWPAGRGRRGVKPETRNKFEI